MGAGEDGLYKIPGQEDGKGWAYYSKEGKKGRCCVCRSDLDMSIKDGICMTKDCPRNETLNKLLKEYI